MPVGAIIGAAGAIGGAVLGGKSQKSAARTAANTAQSTTNANNALTRDIYGQNKAMLAPYVARGDAAGGTINSLLGLGTDAEQATAQGGFRDYMANSDYGFAFGNGAGAINSGYAAQGALQSGAAMKAMEQYRQNLQAGYRGEYMGQLGQQQGVGMGAASALAGVGQNMVGQVSANNNNAGSAAANAALMGGVASNNMYAGIGSALGNFAGNAFGSSYGSRPQSQFGMYPQSQTSAPW